MIEEMIKAYMMRVSDDGVVYKGYIGEIENSLKAKQEFVGGLIQVIPITSEIDLICNDEGKLRNLPINRALFYDTGKKDEMYDFVVGNCLCVRHNNSGYFTSILDEDIPIIRRFVKCIKYNKKFGSISVVDDTDIK